MPQHARMREHADLFGPIDHVLGRKIILKILTNGIFFEWKMIGIHEIKKIESVVAEESESPCQFIDFIQIDIKHEYLLVQFVLFGEEPHMHDIAFIKARVHRDTLFPKSDPAAAIPEEKASSWKPYLK